MEDQLSRFQDTIEERTGVITRSQQLPSRMVPWKQSLAKHFRVLPQTLVPLHCHRYHTMQAAKVFWMAPSQNRDKWPPDTEAISRTQSFPLALGRVKGNATMASLCLACSKSDLKSQRHIPHVQGVTAATLLVQATSGRRKNCHWSFSRTPGE